jgi:hypothetical protein
LGEFHSFIVELLNKPTSNSLMKEFNRGMAPVRDLTALLIDSVSIASSTTGVEFRKAQRNYAIRLIEIGYRGSTIPDEHNRSWKERLPFIRRREHSGWDPAMFWSISKVYWYLRIVQAREDGLLPAWEGIRIVREQSASAELTSKANQPAALSAARRLA